MSIDRRRFLTSSAVTAVAATLGAAVSPRPARAAFGDLPMAGTVTLGVVCPFSGPDAKFGEQLANGVRAAIDEADRMRGPLDRVIGFRTFDDQNLLATGIVNAQFACNDPSISVVIGHLSGRVTNGALNTYATARMPIVVPASSYDPITAHGYPNVFRLPTKDSTEGQLAARYLHDTKKPKTPVTLVQDGDYGYDVSQGFLAGMAAAKVTAHQVLFHWEKPDYAVAAKDALALKPDLIYLAGTAGDMGPVIAELRNGGYKGPITASQGFFDPQTVAKYGAEVDGLVVSTSFPPISFAPTVQILKSDFESRYGQLTPLSAFGYAAAQVAITTIKRTGVTDRAALASQLGRGGLYDTITGQFQFSGTGDPVDPNVYFYTVKAGKWEFEKAAHPSPFLLK